MEFLIYRILMTWRGDSECNYYDDISLALYSICILANRHTLIVDISQGACWVDASSHSLTHDIPENLYIQCRCMRNWSCNSVTLVISTRPMMGRHLGQNKISTPEIGNWECYGPMQILFDVNQNDQIKTEMSWL